MLKDDVIFSRQIADVLAQSLASRQREWHLLYLGGHRWDEAFPEAPGCRFLQTADGRRPAGGRLSSHGVRPDPGGGAGHPYGHGALAPDALGIDQYYAQRFDGTRLVTCPWSPASSPRSRRRPRDSSAPGHRMTDRVLGFRVSFFGVQLTVVSDSAAMAEALDRYILPWLPRAAIDMETADRRVEVRRAGNGAGLEILVDGAVADTAPSPLVAIPECSARWTRRWSPPGGHRRGPRRRRQP